MEKKNEIKFMCKPVREVWNADDYKVYGVDVDTKQYPDIQLNQYDNATICGNFHQLGIGIQYSVKAVPEMGKYGISYKVQNIKRDRPTTLEATQEFLQEILVPSQARELLRVYPDIVQRVIDNNLDDIDLSKLYNIGEYRFNLIKEKIIDNFALVDLVDKFKGTLNISMIKALYSKFPSTEKIMMEMKKDPYKCLCDINRVGFKTADSILNEIDKISQENIANDEEPIIDFGYELKTSKQRCIACIKYLLDDNETNGNTYMDINELKKQSDKLAPACKDHFVDAIKDSMGIRFDKNVMGVALQETYQMEQYVADRVIEAIKYCINETHKQEENTDYKSNIIWDIDYQKYIKQFTLTEEQGKALEYICKYNFFILNGFGGSGKSYTSSAVIKMLLENNKKILLLAPTGRASKILSEYAKYPASTVHRGLQYQPPEWGFNEDCKLSCDVVIIDETSMLDVNLTEKIFKAVDLTKTKIMLIGDSAQLPSVGCGNVLHDLITSKLVPVATLTKIFRYGVGGVLTVATKIRNQERFIESNNTPTIIGEDKGYCFIPTPQEQILARVKVIYQKLIEAGKKPEDIMVLSSYNKGQYGTIVINQLLQPIANKNYNSDTKLEVGDTTYYKDDLIMQTVNNYKAPIYNNNIDDDEFKTFIPNGETGKVVDIVKNSKYEDKMINQFDNDKVNYSKADANMLKLGYCISTHKSQGGSAEIVILITPKAHTYMLNSNLMYVGVTRAKSRVYHLGEVDTVNLALTKKENFNRKTMLGYFLTHRDNNKN